MSTAQSLTTASAYPDRTTTLMVAGVFQILLGGLCGLLSVMMVAVGLFGSMAHAPQGQATNPAAMIQAAVLYAVLAVAFISLGGGLARARRWAWTLTVVASWTWLIMGGAGFVIFLFLVGPGMWASIAQQAKIPPGAIMAMQIGTSALMACIYVLLPGAFLLLCHHESVHMTCLRQDPKIPWTDRCPMPVLALSILLAFSILSMFSMFAYRCVMPLFGVFISGAAGAVVILLIALVLAYLAWGTYRLQMAAWWGTLLLGIVGTVNMAVTFSRTDVMQMYEKMGLPADQLDMIRKMGIVESMSRWGPWLGLVGAAAWLGYLLYIRRYFVHSGEETTAAWPAQG